MIPMIVAFLVLAQAVSAPDPSTCPMHAQHMKKTTAIADSHHGAAVDARHDTFGMPHEAVRHSFRLWRDGGVIELQSIENDEAAVAAIRDHLQSVAGSFSQGDFEKPLFVHGRMPDGAAEMASKGDQISYLYRELPRGGEIRIRTRDAGALAQIHRFLRFQVIEHRTGESGEVEKAVGGSAD